MFSVSKTIRI